MADPIAEAAAAQVAPTEPSMLEKAMETIHTLEAKVEGLMHPDAAPSSTEPVVEAQVEAGNVAEGAAPSSVASEPLPSSAPVAVEQKPQTAGGDIRTHLANIKSHLSLRGFEESLVQDIHGEITAIEGLL